MTLATHTCHTPPGGALRLNAALKADPSRTTMIRYRFVVDVNRRFDALTRDIRVSIVDNDCFSIQGPHALAALPDRAFRFETSQAKVAGFMEWLRGEEEKGILEIIRGPGITPDRPWSNVYIDSAYMRGIRNSDSWLRKAGAGAGGASARFPGGARQAIHIPIHAERVALIYSRTYEDLKSVTDVMNAQVRIKITEGLTTGLARGVAEGKNPRMIARELYKDVKNRIDKIGVTRARTIARTEVMNAHNSAVMTEYELAEKVIGQSIRVDVSLGANPCEICVDLEAGGPYDRVMAMGQLPAHPNCVCVHMPNIESRTSSRRAA